MTVKRLDSPAKPGSDKKDTEMAVNLRFIDYVDKKPDYADKKKQ
jgi:hypothetical protein